MPKLKNLTIQNDPMERLTVNLHESVMLKLSLYKQFYEKELGGKLQLNAVVEEMLKQLMREDKDFEAFVKAHEKERASASAAPKSALPTRDGDAPRTAGVPPAADSNAVAN